MSIQAIPPEYKGWVKEINKNTLSGKVDELNKEFSDITHDILYSDKSDTEINKSIDDVRKRLLYLQLAYNNLHDPDPTINASLTKLASNMSLVNGYEQQEVQKSQKKSLDILTYISIIVLPLTLITGYFGMNFESMGAPAKKNQGILTLYRGQLFVFFLFLVSVVLSVVLLNHYYKIN